MTQPQQVAIIGVTGAVGTVCLEELQRLTAVFPGLQVVGFASERSAGCVLPGLAAPVQSWDADQLGRADAVLLTAGGEFSRQWAPRLAASCRVVVDNSSVWRRDPQVPLVAAGVNDHVLEGYCGGVIANPNCSTLQLVASLAPLRDCFGLEHVHVSTYQSVSGTGFRGLAALERELEGGQPGPSPYPLPIAANLIPGVGGIDAEGRCEEEQKLVYETRRILGLADLPIFASVVRVPTRVGHGETVHVRLRQEVRLEQVREAWQGAPLLEWDASPELGRQPTPRSVAGSRKVHLGRVRLGPSGRDLQYWCVADNLRRGAASNACDILAYVWRSGA